MTSPDTAAGGASQGSGNTANSGSGGGRGGLMVALAISVVLLLVMSFLWAQEKQKNKDGGGGTASNATADLESRLAQAIADRDQAIKDLRRLQATPTGDEELVASLEEKITKLEAERDFAESQRADAADFVIEVQRDLNNFKQTVQEQDARIAQLESELASVRDR